MFYSDFNKIVLNFLINLEILSKSIFTQRGVFQLWWFVKEEKRQSLSHVHSTANITSHSWSEFTWLVSKAVWPLLPPDCLKPGRGLKYHILNGLIMTLNAFWLSCQQDILTNKKIWIKICSRLQFWLAAVFFLWNIIWVWPKLKYDQRVSCASTYKKTFYVPALHNLTDFITSLIRAMAYQLVNSSYQICNFLCPSLSQCPHSPLNFSPFSSLPPLPTFFLCLPLHLLFSHLGYRQTKPIHLNPGLS